MGSVSKGRSHAAIMDVTAGNRHAFSDSASLQQPLLLQQACLFGRETA